MTISYRSQFDAVTELIREGVTSCVKRLNLEMGMLRYLSCEELSEIKRNAPDTEIFIALPRILREDPRGFGYHVSDITDIIEKYDGVTDGFLIRTPGELQMISGFRERGGGTDFGAALDYSLNIWNGYALAEYLDCLGTCGIPEYTMPLELTQKELEELAEAEESSCKRPVKRQMVVYGRIPMMLTANCIRKTFGDCRRGCSDRADRDGTDVEYLTDRKNRNLPVSILCDNCMNIIWNSIPLSLHRQYGVIRKVLKPFCVRTDFSTEDEKEITSVLEYWDMILNGNVPEDPPYGEFTTGHFRQGVL